MEEFETGVYAKYNADVALKAQLTELYNTEAEPNAVMPYGVFQIISNVQRLTFSEDQESFILQFKLFSEKHSSTELNAMYSALKATYDFKTLTMTDYTSVSLKRSNSIKTKIEDAWQYTVSYIILIEKDVSVR